MEISESIFYADSLAIYKFIRMLHGNEGEELRWKFGLVSIDLLLNDFGYNLTDKKRLLAGLSTDFFKEFTLHSSNKGKFVSKVIRERFRKYKLDISILLSKENRNLELIEAYQAFEERSKRIKPLVKEMEGLSMDKKDGLLASYIHMTMNRLFIANQRKHELVIYHFLNKFYESAIARQKIKVNEPTI